jgi:hypothetical protein
VSSICRHDDCGNVAETGSDECYRHRLLSVGFSWRGGGGTYRKAFHERTNAEWMRENLGSADDRDLAKKGIERTGKF